MKNIVKLLGICSLTIILYTSCVDYLDKSPEVNITDEDVFSKFNSYQGFVEGIYQNIVDITLGKDGSVGWNFGDDVRNANTDGICYYWEKGMTTAWLHKSSPYTGYVGGDYKIDNENKRKGYWHNGWYGIRSCNLGLDNLDKLVGTREERDILEGQCLFLRAYFHFEILRAWGGVPYIDTVYASTDILQEPRLSYLQTANRISEDLKKAAELLPTSWDETTVGQATLGSNAGRVTKGAAYGYLGMNLLYAASPLMNGVETGDYNSYNTELCKQAAEAFYEVIKLANQGYHGLESWDKYRDIFYTLTGSPLPISNKEVIFSNPIYKAKRYEMGESIHSNIGGTGNLASVTANYVDNFGMANGLPIDAEGSGYDPADPWVNRDPRFYYSITKDGDRMIMNTNNADTYAQFYVGGRHSKVKNIIVSFAYQKFHHVTCNKYDNGWSNYWYTGKSSLKAG
ncbi:MAG: RagB/SusD family nutrient uptake outer membrane protein [Mangrovibacterium sp.]